MTYQYLDGLDADGTIMGQSASSLIGFHGKAPSDQAAYVAQASNAPLASTGVGFSTTAQFSSAVTLLNAVQALLVEKGLMAAS